MRKIISIAILLLMVWNLGGCALVLLREDVQVSKDSCLLTGEVISNNSLSKPVIVIAYSRKDGAVAIADYAMLSESGQYEILVPHGDYEIFAFQDENGNFAHDPNEWAGYYGKPDKIVSPPAGVAYGLDIILSPRTAQPGASFDKLLADFSGGK